MNKKAIITLLILVAAAVIFYTQFTIFIVAPIGAIPEGKTLIISRLNNMEFIDSADAMCKREQGGVSLLCRIGMLAAVAKNATIYLRLPYSEWLYLISTGGERYSK